MIPRSQPTSSVLKARSIHNAITHGTRRRSKTSKVDSESTTPQSNTDFARKMDTNHPTHQAVERLSFNVPLSSWDLDTPSHSWGSRRPKLTPNTHGAAVSAYYAERRRQCDGISERREDKGDLMAQLSAVILSEGIAAQTCVREKKIPVEIMEADGTVRHPSGFEPPTPASGFHPAITARKLEDKDRNIGSTAKVSWDQIL